MAATVEGTFILIDRASGPARRIKTELRELEMQAHRTGRALDGVGSPKQARSLDQMARETRVFGQEAQTAGREVDTMGQRTEQTSTRMRRAEQDTKRLGTRVKELAVGIRSLKEVFGLLKWPAMIAGAGGLVQVVGGLTTGILGLLPRLTDLAGAGVSLIPLYAGVGGALGAVKLATQGLSQAMAGNKKALANLTPEGRAFLQVLKSYTPELHRAQAAAQRGLFPGLERALTSARRDMPALRRILQQSGADVGNLAGFGVGQLNARGGSFMRELVTLSDEGGRALGSAARGAIYLGEGLTHLGVAAAPFTDWLGNTVVHLSKMAEHELRVRQETGQLGRYFDRTKESLRVMGDTGSHVLHALLETLRAARGEGDSMWTSIDRGAKRWDQWAGSFRGQNEMRRFFADTRPILDETVGLVGDLGKALGGLAQGGEGVQMLQELRKAVPDLARGIRTITGGLGPGIISGLASFVKLISDASANGGALSMFVGLLGTGIRLVDGLVRALGPLGPALTTALGGVLLARRLKLIDAVAGGWRRVAGAERSAASGARAYSRTPTGAAPSVAFGPGGLAGGGGAPGVAYAPGAMAGETQTAGGVILPPGVRSVEAGAAETGGAGLVARGRAGLSSGWAKFTAPTETNFLRAGGGAALRTLGPAALLMGVMGAAQQGLTFPQRAQAFLALGGMNPFVSMPATPAQQRTEGAQGAGEILSGLPQGSGLGAQRGGIGQLRRLIGQPGRQYGQGVLGDRLTALGYRADTEQMAQATAALKQELDRRRKLLAESIRANRDALNAASVDHANRLMTDFGKAFSIRSKHEGPLAAMDETVSGILGKMRDMRPAGARVLGENVLAWAKQQARSNPALLAEVRKLETGIEGSFSRTRQHVFIVNGQILDGSKTEWHNIRLALTSETEKARQQASDDFTAIQQQAVGSLRAMGFSTGSATRLVQAMETGGRAGGVASSLSNAGLSRSQAKATGSSPVRLASRPHGDGPGMSRAMTSKRTGGAADVASSTRGGAIGLMGADPNLEPYAEEAQGYGLQVTSGRRPGAITVSGNVSYHSSGHAVDFGGSPANMRRFALAMAREHGSGLEELIYSPLGWGIKNGQRVPNSYFGQAVIAQHYNHVHVADTDPSGAAGGIAGVRGGGAAGGRAMGRVHLHAPHSTNTGLPGMAVDAAGTLYAGALEQRLNAHLAKMGGGGADYSNVAGAGGGAAANMALGRQMMLAHGWGPDQWPPLKALGTRESGWNANAVNKSSGAYGIGQSLGHGHPYDLGDARGQIAWMLDYIGGRYGSPSAAWAHEQHAGWYANGGDFSVNRPTIFGAGERADGRPERVTITPQPIGPRMTRPVFRGPLMERGALHIEARGADAQEVARLVGGHLENFAQMVRDELAGGEDLADSEAVIG